MTEPVTKKKTRRVTAAKSRPVSSLQVSKAIALVGAMAEPQAIFNSTALIQATLPHRDPGQVPEWIRQNGRTTLSVIPLREGQIDNRRAAYPYGVYPRLILFWAATEVQRLHAAGENSRVLYLGNSLKEFMGKIGVSIGGKQYRDLTAQVRRLFGATITYAENGESMSLEATAPVADVRAFWWDSKNPDQTTLFDSSVRLSEIFHGYLLNRAYPMDENIIRVIKNSSLALDLYAWLCLRTYSLEKPVSLSWATLAKQLGADFGRSRDFANTARKHLATIQALWPGLTITEEHGERGKGGRLMLHPSRPSLPPRNK